MKVMLLALMLGAPALLAQKASCPALTTSVADAVFAPGQIWTYTTRPEEPNSTLTVLRLDRSAKMGLIVHVRVDGLEMRNPRGERVEHVMHMPFYRAALLGSIGKQVGTAVPLPTLEGLEVWQNDCGGVYTISVRAAVEVAQTTFLQGHSLVTNLFSVSSNSASH